jgi:hypothetical protein
MLKDYRDTETIRMKKWGTNKSQKQTQKLRRPGERSDNQYSDLQFDRGDHKDPNKFKNGASN